MNSGNWSEVMPWPIVAIHSIVTPDAKILTFGTDQTGQQGSHMLYDLWDPATGLHTTLNYVQNTNIFCSCCVIDPITDQIIIAGGDAGPLGTVNVGVPYTHTFDYHTDQLSLHPETTLNYSRWYATSLTLADGRVFLLGGVDGNSAGVGTPEVYTHGVGWETLQGASSADIGLIGTIRAHGCRAMAQLSATPPLEKAPMPAPYSKSTSPGRVRSPI